jgi:hypothetical protein
MAVKQSEADVFQRMLAVTKLTQLLENDPSFSGSSEDAQEIAGRLIGRAVPGGVAVKLQKGTVAVTWEMMPANDDLGSPPAGEAGESAPEL